MAKCLVSWVVGDHAGYPALPAERSVVAPRATDRVGQVRHILRDQLQVSEPEFWTCVRDGVKPARGAAEPPAEALPADLAHLLINRVSLSEPEMAAMSKVEAVERLNRYWTEGT